MFFDGTNVILSKGNDEIIGQMDMTINYTGSPIDLTNKALGRWRELRPEGLTEKQIIIDVSITFTSDATFKQIISDTETATGAVYKVSYPNGSFFSCFMIPANLSYNAAKDSVLQASLQFISSDADGRQEQATNALVTVLYPVQVFEDAVTGSVSVSDIRELTVNIETPIMSGSVGIDEIIVISDEAPIYYTEIEKEITGSVEVESIEQVKVLVSYEEIEKEISGTVLIESIDQTEVLVPYAESEKEITGTISITEITKA